MKAFKSCLSLKLVVSISLYNQSQHCDRRVFFAALVCFLEVGGEHASAGTRSLCVMTDAGPPPVAEHPNVASVPQVCRQPQKCLQKS